METDETLKQQFKLLQEQQQMKLLRRKQMKEEKENASNNSAKNKTFGVDDNLDLKIETNSTSNYISEELVEHLNNQIRELRDENGRCYKLLSERDFEIKQLKKKKTEEKNALSGIQVTNETAATKIVELSKKVRELTAELESEKNKNRQMGKKCHELQTQLSAIPVDTRSDLGSAVSYRSVYTDNEKEQSELDIRALQEKLKQTESKVAEFRNQSSQLKQELKIAHKVLNQEVGENVNIQSLLSGNTNWRGRAQQILLLQKKVDELKNRVEKSPGKTRDDEEMENDFMGRTTSSRRKNQDEKYREELRKLDKEKKEAQEKLVNEYKALENDYSALKSKMEAAKARNKVLSTEVKAAKQQMATLLEKGKNDDELIQALMKQQSQLKEMLDTATTQQAQNSLNQQGILKELSVKAQQDNNIVEQLKSIVAEKEFKVHQLEEEINNLKLQHLQKMQMEGVANIFQKQEKSLIGSSRPQTAANETMGIQSVTPPSSRPPTVSGRVDSARSMSRSSVRPSSSRNAVNPTVGELQYQCQEYKILMQTAEVEKEKLAELVQILQKRVEEGTIKLNESQTELINQRRNNALLEKQLARHKVIVDQNKLNKGNTSARKKGLSSSRVSGDHSFNDEEIDSHSLDEIQTRLEIQQDENEALKSALNSTLQAKEEDLRIYSTTIDETKKVLLQALRQYKQSVVQHGT